ncbi:hypothetical protein [Laspinema olomoucense]|uniref:Uncharacterized protein n=1 Tax=Laspinema olomoucense D3b TaxID=2953688 RepID=A0ABT2N5J4_9CYAN|nr:MULTISPECIES: hypothetical protein [unclassified Laspinema]MCT7977963.1 hypothetical protein [Laspinema sp. D3b]MCT7987029.1 hypothetical protein [Laspinema sp. D3a]
MTQEFRHKRFDKGHVIPHSFLEEFRTKAPSTRRYLLNSLTLFACISPEQQHQALNDLIQSELVSLAEKTQNYLHDRIHTVLQHFGIDEAGESKRIAEYYYRYYLLTGAIPENLTTEYLTHLLNFIIGIEVIKIIFRMSFIEQQRFFEIQGRYAIQVMIFYRYIKPIRDKLIQEKLISRDVSGSYYYTKANLSEDKILDYIFEVFKLEKIETLGELAKDLQFDREYIYKPPHADDRDVPVF